MTKTLVLIDDEDSLRRHSGDATTQLAALTTANPAGRRAYLALMGSALARRTPSS